MQAHADPIWCCLQVVQALHGCFQNDTVSFLDEARFHRLLPLLVQQLSMQLPADVAAGLQAQPADDADSAAGSDVFGDAVVAALVQMAVTANSDALWKPLNHQVTLLASSDLEPDCTASHLHCIHSACDQHHLLTLLIAVFCGSGHSTVL